MQERLTKQIADWLDEHLAPKGVGVVIEAEHTCMTLRGVQAAGSSTVTSTLLGTLRDDPRSRAEFLALTGVTPWDLPGSEADIAAIRLQADELASYAFVDAGHVPELASASLARRIAACLEAVAVGTTVSLENGHPAG